MILVKTNLGIMCRDHSTVSRCNLLYGLALNVGRIDSHVHCRKTCWPYLTIGTSTTTRRFYCHKVSVRFLPDKTKVAVSL